MPSLSKPKALIKIIGLPVISSKTDPAPVSISPKILPSVLNAKSLDLILFLSVIVLPSWSTIGAEPTHKNIVPAGNIPVETGRTPIPNGELIPVISFSSTIVSVPLLLTLNLLI